MLIFPGSGSGACVSGSLNQRNGEGDEQRQEQLQMLEANNHSLIQQLHQQQEQLQQLTSMLQEARSNGAAISQAVQAAPESVNRLVEILIF